MIKKYRKKPVIIEALAFSGDNKDEIRSFIKKGTDYFFDGEIIRIRTREGFMIVRIGNYIIKGVKGEFYPCKKDIFEQTYEEVEA